MSHHGGHGYTVTRYVRATRRTRAEEIDSESGYKSLSTEKKLERVLAFIAVPGNGNAARQLARLQAQLQKEKTSQARK